MASTSSVSKARAGQREQFATRAVFLIAGLAKSTWAPLVPYAKHRLNVDEASLGFLLLCLGIGSLVAMPVTGALTSRFGCRSVIATSAVLTALILPLLVLSNSSVELAISLALFGGAVGTLDVSMNSQAVIVEKDSGRSMMSGFHGLFSLGGIFGAGDVSVLLGAGAFPLTCTIAVTAIIMALLLYSYSGLLPYGNRDTTDTPHFAIPRGVVIVLGVLCFVVFLSEGAVLDWSALFLTSIKAMEPAQAGFGYAVFAVAMTAGRLTGDRIVQFIGRTRTVVIGSLMTAAGFVIAVLAPTSLLAIAAFAIVGLGASNIVPVFFTAAGNQTRMPSNLAVAAMATMGYAGVLCGPASIGFIAHASSLSVAFLMLSTALVATSFAGPIVLQNAAGKKFG